MGANKREIMRQVKALAYVAIEHLAHRTDIQDDEDGFCKVMEIVTMVNGIGAEFWANNKEQNDDK